MIFLSIAYYLVVTEYLIEVATTKKQHMSTVVRLNGSTCPFIVTPGSGGAGIPFALAKYLGMWGTKKYGFWTVLISIGNG